MINNSKHQIISSNIAPNPIEVKFWLDTNSDTLKTYKDGKWEAMTGGGSSNSDEPYMLDVTEILNAEPDKNGVIQISEKLYNEIPKVAGKCTTAKMEMKTDESFMFQTIHLDWYGGNDGGETSYYITLYWTIPGGFELDFLLFLWSSSEKNCIIKMTKESMG